MPPEQPWHAAFPSPTLEAELILRRRVMMTLSLKIASLLIIDVRRTDYEGGSIRGSLNIPAQGFFWNRGMLYELAYKAGMEIIVFTCNSCSPGGRGPRCAAWFLEFVRNVAGDDDMQILSLEGGMKGWVQSGVEYTGLMDAYRPEYWEEMFAKDGKGKDSTAVVDTATDGAAGLATDVSKQ